MVLLLLPCLISVVYSQGLQQSSQYDKQYNKHITPVDYEVPHEVIFKDQQCWTTEEGDLVVPGNCSSSYCSQCFFNKDIRDYRNHYISPNDRLIVGALDTILAFDVTDSLFLKIQQVDAAPPQIDAVAQPSCLGNQYKMESCRNYNRILLGAFPEPGKILTCGTNAYSVNADNACQIREVNNLTSYRRLKGEALVPINENAWNTALFSDSRIFAGTMMSNSPDRNAFVVSSAKIGTKSGEGKAFVSIVATTPNAAWLNRAKFVASFSSGDYAYFLFQEIDYIYDPANAIKNKVVSRIARVCKEDGGVQADDLSEIIEGARLWRTFVKARIYCENKVNDPTFGEQTFTYNRIGDGVIDGQRILYAAFSEGDTSASGSVVCRFNLTEIDQNFDSAKYWNFDDGNRAKAEDRTSPTCEAMDNSESKDIYYLRLTVDAVSSKDPPLFLQPGPQFTKLLIDSNVRNMSNPVLFIGTNMGKVLKVTWISTTKGGLFQPILIESLQVAKGDISSDLKVNFLAFEKTSDPNYLFVGTGTSVSKVVISRCLRLPNLSRNCCYAARDPYCGWCESQGQCTSKPDCSSDWVQSLTAEPPETCERQDNTQPPPTTLPPPIPTEPDITEGRVTDPPIPRPTTGPDIVETDPPITTNQTEPAPQPPNTTATQPAPDKNNTVEPATKSKNDTSDPNSNGNNADEEAVKSETASWKTVAIVMAILCGIFVLISALLALNLARKWCYSNRQPPQKQGNHNMQHSYNPLSSAGQKPDDFSDRIPVYKPRTNNV